MQMWKLKDIVEKNSVHSGTNELYAAPHPKLRAHLSKATCAATGLMMYKGQLALQIPKTKSVQ
jgi:hypothetical protein